MTAESLTRRTSIRVTLTDRTDPERIQVRQEVRNVIVTIDVTAIVQDLATRAAYNRTGRATAYGGHLKAKRY